jgi:hypothetical protein
LEQGSNRAPLCEIASRRAASFYFRKIEAIDAISIRATTAAAIRPMRVAIRSTRQCSTSAFADDLASELLSGGRIARDYQGGRRPETSMPRIPGASQAGAHGTSRSPRNALRRNSLRRTGMFPRVGGRRYLGTDPDGRAGQGNRNMRRGSTRMSQRSRECGSAGDIRGRSRMSRSLSSGAHSRDPLAHAGYTRLQAGIARSGDTPGGHKMCVSARPRRYDA